jgi:CBS domain-containing protein
MLVSEIMSTSVVSIRREATLNEAIALLGGRGVSALPVVDPDGRLVGIVSEADVLRQSLPNDPRAHLRPTEPAPDREPTVDDIMTDDPVHVAPHGDCADVGQVLADTGWKSMPVVEDGRLVGMVSRSDIVRALAVDDAALSAAVREAFTTAGHPEWVPVVRAGHVTLSLPPGRLAEAAVAIASTVAGVRSVQLAHRTDQPSGPGAPR